MGKSQEINQSIYIIGENEKLRIRGTETDIEKRYTKLALILHIYNQFM